jgi:hypothetical protein
MRNAYKILDGKVNGKYYSENLGVDGRIILDCIFETYRKNLNGFIWL